MPFHDHIPWASPPLHPTPTHNSMNLTKHMQHGSSTHMSYPCHTWETNHRPRRQDYMSQHCHKPMVPNSPNSALSKTMKENCICEIPSTFQIEFCVAIWSFDFKEIRCMCGGEGGSVVFLVWRRLWRVYSTVHVSQACCNSLLHSQPELCDLGGLPKQQMGSDGIQMKFMYSNVYTSLVT